MASPEVNSTSNKTCCFVQSRLSCQARMATLVGKWSSLTRRTPCILTMIRTTTQHLICSLSIDCLAYLKYQVFVICCSRRIPGHRSRCIAPTSRPTDLENMFMRCFSSSCPLVTIRWRFTCMSVGFILVLFHVILDSGPSRPDRLKDIADRFNVDHGAVLDNVLYARAYTSTDTLHF